MRPARYYEPGGGLALVQMARLAGARVLAVGRTEVGGGLGEGVEGVEGVEDVAQASSACRNANNSPSTETICRDAGAQPRLTPHLSYTRLIPTEFASRSRGGMP
jgi:hypothetical protein